MVMYNLLNIRKHARELRRAQTESEKFLWEKLRNRKLSGYKFLRQHPIIYKEEGKSFRYFIADFYCHSKNVVIELDGPVHDNTLEKDFFRDNEMSILGLKVLRLKNEELIDIDSSLEKIVSFLNSIPTG